MSTTADRMHDNRQNLRLEVPPRPAASSSATTSTVYASFPTSTPSSTRSSMSLPSPFPFAPSSFPSATSSKRRSSTFTLSSTSSSSSSSYSSLSSLFLLLFSLRSLYSLLPFLRSSSPSFSLFPFSFLVSLFSLLVTVVVSSVLPSSDPHNCNTIKSLAFHSSVLRPLATKSLLLALVFLLRFQGLRSCGTATTILVDFCGAIAARSLFERDRFDGGRGDGRKIRGFAALSAAILVQSYSWHRVGCSLFSRSDGKGEDCSMVINVLLPFLSGFFGYMERSSSNWVVLRPLGRKRIRLYSLAFATMWLFFPAFVNFLMPGEEKDGEVLILNIGWPLVNTVIFGVVLSENNGEDRSAPNSKDVRREFLVTFVCTLVLELFYFPRFSMPGFFICGFLMWIAVDQLCSASSDYIELGTSGKSESLYVLIRNPIRHILSEKKSRKIALFLLINACYMVVEFTAGFMSNSLGLISDACHMLFDCAALAIGLYASYISRLPANSQFNYGLGRFEVLSGYVNAVFLVLVGALIVLESLERILDPQEISTNSLLTVSIGGLLVNVVGLVFFHEEHHHAHGGGGSCSHTHSHSSTDHHHHSHDHHHHSSTDHHHHFHDHHQHSSTDHHHHSHDHHHPSQDPKHPTVTVQYRNSHNCNDPIKDHHHHSSTVHHHHSHDHHHPSQDAKHPTVTVQYHNSHNSNDPIEDHHHHSHDHHHHCDEHVRDDHDTSMKHYPAKLVVHEPPLSHSHGNCSNLGTHQQHQNYICHDLDRGGSMHSHDAQMHGLSSKTNCTHHIQEASSCSSHCQNHVDHTDENENNDGSSLSRQNHAHTPDDNGIAVSNPTNLATEEKHNGHKKHRHIDHNMEGIFLHVLADTLGSVGVVISTLLIKYKGWLASDPACSIFISLMIVSSVLPLLRNSAEILLQGISKTHEKDLKMALDDIMRLTGVSGIQNVHFWNFTNSEVVGTLNILVSNVADTESLRKKVSHILHDIGVKDLTIQVEHVKAQ